MFTARLHGLNQSPFLLWFYRFLFHKAEPGEALRYALSIAQQLNRSDGLQLGCRNSKMAVSFFPVA